MTFTKFPLRTMSLVAALAWPGLGSAQSSSASQNDLVAMLHSVDTSGQFDGSLCGSALLLSQSDGRTLLLTAKHVLTQLEEENRSRSLVGEPPVQLGAQFFGAVGTFHEVRPLPGLFNDELDYAVVEVVPRTGKTIAPPQAWQRLGAIEDPENESGKPVFKDVRAVGYSRCRPWAASTSPEKVMSVGGTDIKFETRFVDHGSSGGALFAADGGLVGMVVKTDGDEGTARSIDVILSDLVLKNVKIDLSYGDQAEGLGPESSEAATTYASMVKATSISSRIVSTGGKGVRLRPNLGDVGVPVSNATLVGSNDNRDISYNIDLDIIDVLARPYEARVAFSDGSSVTLPIDLKTPLIARIKALTESDTAWLYYHGAGSVGISSPQFEVRGLIRSIDVGWSPNVLPHHAVYRYSGFEAPKLTGAAALNAVNEDRKIVGPPDADRAWYRLTFADGSVSPPRALIFTPEQMARKASDPARSHLVTTPEGVVFSYRYLQDDVGPVRAGGSFALSQPYGLVGSYRMQYDLDGKGFLDAEQGRIPWTSSPFKVRFMDAAIGTVTASFSLSAPDITAVRDDAPAVFPQISCRRAPGGAATCQFSDFRVIGHIKAWRASFVSETQLRPMALGDLRPVWRTIDGRYRIRACRNAYDVQCQQWHRELGALWDIPERATDFYYSVTMNDGRTSPTQRVSLPQ